MSIFLNQKNNGPNSDISRTGHRKPQEAAKQVQRIFLGQLSLTSKFLNPDLDPDLNSVPKSPFFWICIHTDMHSMLTVELQ